MDDNRYVVMCGNHHRTYFLNFFGQLQESMNRDMKHEIKKATEYQYRYLAKKKQAVWKLVTLLIPSQLEMPVKTYSKFLLTQHKTPML